MAQISYYKLTGETPSKKNSRQVFRGGKNIPSKNYLMWFKRAEIEIFRQGILVPAIICPIEIKLVFHHKDDNWKIVRKITAEAVKDDEAYVEVELNMI